MKANPDKFQFIILGNAGSDTLQIGDITIKSVSSVHYLVLLLIQNFKEHINNIIKKEKAYYKLYALIRLRKFLT